MERVVGVVRDQKLKLEEVKASHTLRWSGGMGYLRRGKWMRDERVESGKGVRVCVNLQDHHRC